MEPNYVGSNGRIDALAAAWLLDYDHVFFLDNEITWDGTNHGIAGAQFNIATADEAPVFTANYQMLMGGVVDLMNTLEQDNGLRVPRHMVHESLHEAIREGDLTGITLFNLIACGHAIKLSQNGENAYQVFYDNRLARGIPSFYQLVARMVWDMRDYNDIQGPLEIMFASARNLDADQYLRDFNDAVPGATSQPFWTESVSEQPVVKLPAEEEVSAFAEAQSRQFASGFDAPTEMQADEELFETALNQVANEFPQDIGIEGTHVFDRIPRIENVKVGDALVLASDWNNSYFDPVCIEVFNAQGETLGNLANHFWTAAGPGYREFACLLPYMTATVQSVTPLSARRKGSKYALMDVHIEIDPGIFDSGLWSPTLAPAVVDEAKKLLALPRAERVLLSKGDIVASNLKGCISTEKATDTPNPIGSTHQKEETPDAEVVESPEEAPADGAENPLEALMSTMKALQELAESIAEEHGIDLSEQESAPVTEVEAWTFEQGKTAKGRRFTIELPDQFAFVENCGGRPLAVPAADFQEGDDPDYSECTQIIYSDLAGDLDQESIENLTSNLIPEAKIQLNRKTLYEAERFMGGGAVNDWVVEGRNCLVQVVEAKLPSFFGGAPSYEYQVQPVVFDHNNMLRLTDSYTHLAPGQLKELALAIAKTVEVDKQIPLKQIERLDRYKQELADPDEFRETVNVVGNVLVLSSGWHISADTWRDKRQADDDAAFAQSYPKTIATAFVESLEERIDYVERFVEILKAQKELGNPEYPSMWKLINDAADLLIVDRLETTEQSEMYESANATGIIAIPERYTVIHDALMALAPDNAEGTASNSEVEEASAAEAQETPAHTISEPHKTAAIPRIEKMLSEPVTGAYFVETSEIVANELMAARQNACDAATKSYATDEDNVTAMAAEFDKFNAVFCRYLGYFVDAIEAQAKLGVDKREIETMAVEANEFSELVANRFSCGNSYLDKVANSRHPIKRPAEFAELQSRLRKVMFG